MRLLRQDIDVYAELGDEGHNEGIHYKLGLKRADNTLKFMKDNGIILKDKVVIDIAGPSVLGGHAAKDAKAYYGTTGDLDNIYPRSEWYCNAEEADVVLMWEVLEHLLNPLAFFEELKDGYTFDVMVVTWPIRPSWLWTNLHFHEMRLDRFEYLCKRAGYKIVAYKKDKIPTHWTSMFMGIRPFIRHFYNPHCMAIIKPV